MSEKDSTSNIMKKFTKEEIEMVRIGFEEADKNGDGVLEKDEMKHILSELGVELSEEDFERYFEMLDENGDGVISFEEWLKGMAEEDEI